MSIDLAIKGKQLLLQAGLKPGIILLKDGLIADVLFTLDYTIEAPVVDTGDDIVMAGIIDPHVHINEPGRTEWEGFNTATKAAAAGGITTLVDMPLNSSPVTTSALNFKEKRNAAENNIHVNCGFWGGVIPGNHEQLEELLESGVLGLKAFLTHSGIDDFPNASRDDLRKALVLLKKYNKPLLVHCELDTPHDGIDFLDKNPTSYKAYLASRPRSWEDKAITMMIELCRETEAHVHIVHLSSADSIEQIVAAKRESLPLTVETAQHYLVFNSEEIADCDTRFKCAPPIRERENNDRLWEALRDGTIDFVATDHSPAPPELKEIESGNFKKAWGGIAGLQFALPALWTEAKRRNCKLQDITKWMSSNPALFIHKNASKGKIKKGYDADITVWNPDKKFTVDTSMILHRHKLTPYQGLELYGTIEQTYINGKKVYDQGKFLNLNAGKIMLFG